jgi:esterase FrsA
MSFGGDFSAITGLSGVIDVAVVLGSPVDKTFGKDVMTNLPCGMADTMGNDMGFHHQPTKQEFTTAAATFSRRALLDRTDNAPMLVINGANDLLVPPGRYICLRRPREDRSPHAAGHRTLRRLKAAALHI